MAGRVESRERLPVGQDGPVNIERSSLSRRALEVAPDLLGCMIARTSEEGTVAVRITEVEAYEGADDPGSHGYRGRTERNAVMFGPAGHLYVYFTYGMHWCANIVCGPGGVCSAVLLRAGEVTEGVELGRKRRPAARSDRDLARGPARLAGVLGLDRADNGADLLSPEGDVRLYADVGRRPSDTIRTGPRVGLANGAARPWRFWLDGNPTVSQYRPHKRRR
ncbi:MAG TPA: DNA-3-methyladenine glycosylase [Jiangellaceae bacterium]